MLHEALMLEIYRQALNAGALPAARPRSTDSAHSSERCPSHDSNSSENGRSDTRDPGIMLGPLPPSNATFPTGLPQNLPTQPPSMETYLQMVAAAAHQYGFPLGVAAAPTLPLPLPTDVNAHFKLPQPQASPTASSNHSEALDFRTSTFARSESAEPVASEEEEEYEDVDEETNNADNPLDLSVGGRKRSAENSNNESHVGKIQVKKVYKTDSNTLPSPVVAQAPLLPPVNPYLAAVAAANIFRTGQFPDWNGKNDLVVDPLEKMSDIVKGPRKDKSNRTPNALSSPQSQIVASSAPQTNTTNTMPSPTTVSENAPKTRHNIWQSHWQNKGVASSVFRCVWCKQSFSTLEALTTHMKDSKHCGVNVPPFSNLPNADRSHQPIQSLPTAQSIGGQHSHNLRKHNHTNNSSDNNSGNVSAAAKNAFQYRGDPPTPLPRKLVRGQNVWLGKGVEQAMQILKCMRCGESFRSLGEMTKHMQETQHYTNILSQEQTISMKSSASSNDNKDGQSLSSEESRTLSAVLTCKVCDKAFNSLGDLSNHMAKNNHYAEPLMQSMGVAGHRKRPAPKKREKSLPVRKLLEMKGAQVETNHMDGKMTRPYDNSKHMKMDGNADKSETALFAERMRQYITGVKPAEELKMLPKTKSPEVELKNGTNRGSTNNAGSNSVLSAIEQMFATSFDTPVRHTNLPANSPSNSSTKNTSPVASSILKRLGIDETVDYNKPLMDTTDPYYQHYRYTSSERSGSECSAETQVETRKTKIEKAEESVRKTSPVAHSDKNEEKSETKEAVTQVKVEIKTETLEEETKFKSEGEEDLSEESALPNGNIENRSVRNSPKSDISRNIPRSPADSHRSATPKSPESSVKSYDGEKKYPSDSLNALSSMFDSLGSSSSNVNRAPSSSKVESPDHLNSTTSSLSALRQFCVKKEKTA